MKKKILLMKKFSFNNFFTKLALNLADKLPLALNKLYLDSVVDYYKRFPNTDNQKFTFLPTPKDEFFKSFKNTKPEKASGLDNFPKRFLKDGAVVLCNFR